MREEFVALAFLFPLESLLQGCKVAYTHMWLVNGTRNDASCALSRHERCDAFMAIPRMGKWKVWMQGGIPRCLSVPKRHDRRDEGWLVWGIIAVKG